MSDPSRNDPDTLLARAAKLKLFAVVRRTRDQARLKERLSDHLRWMIQQEQIGKIFLSGPVSSGNGATQLDGLTIVRADALDAAQSIVNDDPLVASGIVEVDVFEWVVNEGGLHLFVTLSDSTVRFS